MPNTSLFLGLYVEINGVMFSSTFFCVFNKIFLGIRKALKIPALITSIGYCLLLRIEGATFVPIAVPFMCLKYSLLNEKILFSNMMFKASMINVLL